jgi:transposase-like protein
MHDGLGQCCTTQGARCHAGSGVEDRVRTAEQTICQALIDAELTAVIGAGPWERSAERTTRRNGSWARVLTTTAGDLELRTTKLRSGSFFPSLLKRRRRVDQASFAVAMEAYLHGVPTRKSRTCSHRWSSSERSE